MSIAQLLTARQLAEHLQDSGLIILDCRYALDDPGYGRHAYAASHIPEAHFVDLQDDLSGPVQPGVSGRHPLPDVPLLIEKLRRWGVNNKSDILLYDDGPGAFAARAWWLLVWLGKQEGVYLLDGGLQSWLAAGLPLTRKAPAATTGNFHGNPDNRLLLDAASLQQRLGDPDLTLLDARALPRFRGEVEPLDPVAGHIPGARCAAFTDNLDADGHFRSASQLRERFSRLLQERPPESLVNYCGSGVTACHNLFSLCLAGFALTPLYAGSWSEWVTDPTRPVARGD